MQKHNVDRPAGLDSAATLWPPLAFFIQWEARLGAWASRQPSTRFLYEFIRFGVKQAWACLFGAAMLVLLIGTYLFYPKEPIWLARYDLILIAAVMIQALMLRFGLETWEEARVIMAFHIVGTAMEVT